MKKRWLSLFLTVLMLLSLLPAAAAEEAAEAQTAESVVLLSEEEPPAEEESPYATLLEDLEEAELMELPSVSHGTWASAAVLAPGEQVAYTLDSYSSSLTAQQVWLKLTVEKDDQAVALQFVNVQKGTYAYIYRPSVLESEGPRSNNYAARFSFSGSYAGSWKADYAGVYYLMLMPTGSGNISDTAAAVSYTLEDGDLNEPNGGPASATELTENVSTYFTLNGFNDADWFKLTTTQPGEGVKLYLSNFDYTVGNVYARIFRAADCSDGLSPADNKAVWSVEFSGNGSAMYKSNEPGVYFLKLSPKDSNVGVKRPLRARFELVPGDEQEINDSWNAASTVPYDYPLNFTLNGLNDEDWFYFETSKVNEIVTLKLSGFETNYSNSIAYDIYDAAYDGLTGEIAGTGSRVYYQTEVNITHSRQMSFSALGGHFLRIQRKNAAYVEPPLTLILSSNAEADVQEPNDTWREATLLVEGSPTSFNLPLGDTDWFLITADEPNQTLELDLTIPAGGSVVSYLWSGADLETQGGNATQYYRWDYSATGNGSGSGVKKYRCMLNEAGEYYLRLRPFKESSAFDADATITYYLIQADEQEQNNNWKSAATLNEGIAVDFTLPAANDQDWFRVVSTEPDQTLELTLTIPAGGSTSTYLWSGNGFETAGDNADYMARWDYSATGSGSGSGVKEYRWMLGEAGDYYVRVTPFNANKVFDEDATITYRLIQPDSHERNNGWKTATTLNEGIATAFTLSATNDQDWFRVTTTEPNETLRILLDIPAGGSTSTYLWSGNGFETAGDNADYMARWDYSATGSGSGSGVKEYRWMLEEAGDYYIRVTAFNANKVFDNAASVTYRLIHPDGYERNNAWNQAYELSARTAAGITMPAANDYDWFHIGPLTSGDRLQVSWGGLGAGYTSTKGLRCYLYYVGEYDTSATEVSYFTFYKAGSGTQTITIGKDADYYLRFIPNGGAILDDPLWIKYAVTAADMPVTGIESIGNGDRTIFETQTLQLYAYVTPANATNQEVTWSSSDPTIVTVDEGGLVTGVKTGSATITAVTKDGSYEAATKITVADFLPVTGVSIRAEGDHSGKGVSVDNPYYLALDTGIQLTDLVEPSGATELGVTWSVSDEEVLAVNEYGKVFAVGSGAARAIVTTLDGGYQAEFFFNVPDESYPVRGIGLDKNTETLYLGEGSLQLTATVSPSYATNPLVVWSSDNEAVATVDQEGKVTPVAKGYATITVAAAENAAVRNSCAVTVLPPRTRVTGVSFPDCPEGEVQLGLYGTLQLEPQIAPSDATDKTVTWTTSNKNIATVSRTGVVTALNLGVVEITATTRDGEFSATVTVRISATAALGDLNNDGDIDAGDAMLVLRSSVGLLALTEAQKAVGDVNGDGDIDAGDAVLILRYDAGLIDSFPAES